MKRSERARLLLRVVERLSQDDWPTIDLVLGQFEGKRTDDWQGSKQSYVGWSLESVDDDVLSELGEFLGLTGTAVPAEQLEIGVVEISEVQRIWGEDPCLRLFLSHISRNKSDAATLKGALKSYGISAFVAHADIQPTKEWLEEILRALKTMDALAALLAPEFHASSWTDQEIGYALGRNVPIINLRFGQDPYGFIGRFQALNCANLEPAQTAKSLARLLIENPTSRSATADTLARKLTHAETYAQSKSLMDILEVPTSLPRATLEQVSRARAENDQVKDAWGIPDRIERLLHKHGLRKIEPKPDLDEIPF
jgi:hypothetical protein